MWQQRKYQSSAVLALCTGNPSVCGKTVSHQWIPFKKGRWCGRLLLLDVVITLCYCDFIYLFMHLLIYLFSVWNSSVLNIMVCIESFTYAVLISINSLCWLQRKLLFWQLTVQHLTEMLLCKSLRTNDSQFDNFVVTGDTVSCHYDNLRCHQSWQNYQIEGTALQRVLTSSKSNLLLYQRPAEADISTFN